MKEFSTSAGRVHQHRDQSFGKCTENLQGISCLSHPPGSELLDGYLAGIDRLSERDRAPDSKRPDQFRHHQAQTGTEKADGDTCGEVTTATDNDYRRHLDIKPQIWDGIREGRKNRIKRKRLFVREIQIRVE
jgi:hypothetical protein